MLDGIKKSFSTFLYGDEREDESFDREYELEDLNRNDYRIGGTREVNLEHVESYNHKIVNIAVVERQEANKIIGHLQNGHTVICDFSRTDPNTARSLYAYIAGGAFASNSKINKLSDYMFIMTPKAVAYLSNKETSTFANQANQTNNENIILTR